MKEKQKHAALSVKRIPFSKAVPHEKNPRTHPPEGTPEWDALRDSLKHSYFDPLVWNQRNGKLVSGHYRQKVLISQGFTSADMVIVNWDEKTHVARLVAANQQMGSWNDEALLKLVRQADKGALSMEKLAMTQETITALIEESKPVEPKEPKGPRQSDDEYSLFELVMKHENKVLLVDTLDQMRKKEGIPTLEECLVKLCKAYRRKLK